jgi:hypothetical protein
MSGRHPPPASRDARPALLPRRSQLGRAYHPTSPSVSAWFVLAFACEYWRTLPSSSAPLSTLDARRVGRSSARAEPRKDGSGRVCGQSSGASWEPLSWSRLFLPVPNRWKPSRGSCSPTAIGWWSRSSRRLPSARGPASQPLTASVSTTVAFRKPHALDRSARHDVMLRTHIEADWAAPAATRR